MGPMIGVLFDGFAYGMLLFLLSVGLSVTLGMMNFVNLAHCTFGMIGGYTTVTLMNKAYVAAFRQANNFRPNFISLGGYDGMHVIYEALKKTNGDADGEKLIEAAKGMKWESPRGPMQIDPETRDAIENVYIRRVEKVDGKLKNVEIDTIPNVKDPFKARMPKQ